jgi:hypothetical protein
MESLRHLRKGAKTPVPAFRSALQAQNRGLRRIAGTLDVMFAPNLTCTPAKLLQQSHLHISRSTEQILRSVAVVQNDRAADFAVALAAIRRCAMKADLPYF